ncbi:hypothetical protein E4U55_004750 [Claviceps digitariae]|nr:hypothetical protein E4U55_004750 [Claviceps digitariae]
MPVPWHPLSRSLEPLQLYRHLLRETSYLPPAIQKTIESTIRKRFRNHRPHGEHTKQRLAKARYSLRTLRAANSGDKKAMQKLLLRGFGRAGNRRRELMAEVVKPQGPANSQALESLLDQTSASGTTEQQQCPTAALNTSDQGASMAEDSSRKPKNSFFERWDRDKLLQLMRSQKQQQSSTKNSTSWPGQLIRKTNPDQQLPKMNAWGKPATAILLRAKLASWWRRNAEKLMPPLGKGEWDLLQRLSKGGQDTDEWAVPARRPHGLTRSASKAVIPSDDQWDWVAYASASTARVENPRTRLQRRRTGLHDSGPYGGRLSRNELSSRWLRRAYNRTWQLTPMMEQEPNTLRYIFKWGGTGPEMPSATTSQMHIFEGTDPEGHVSCGESDGHGLCGEPDGHVLCGESDA